MTRTYLPRLREKWYNNSYLVTHQLSNILMLRQYGFPFADEIFIFISRVTVLLFILNGIPFVRGTQLNNNCHFMSHLFFLSTDTYICHMVPSYHPLWCESRLVTVVTPQTYFIISQNEYLFLNQLWWQGAHIPDALQVTVQYVSDFLWLLYGLLVCVPNGACQAGVCN